VTIVDAHYHVWDLSARDQPWLAQSELAPLRRNFALSDLKPEAVAQGVTATVLVQTVTEPEETPEMLALAAADDLVAGVVGWVDLDAPGVPDAVAALRQGPGGDLLVGIRHPLLTEPDPGWLARPAVLRGLAAVAAAGLVFDVVGEPRQLAAAVTAAAAKQELKFVLDHLGKPDVCAGVDEVWASAVRGLAALPNTVAKLSGILAEPASGPAVPADTARPADGARTGHIRPFYEIALSCFGPGRLVFGSDWPVSTLTASYADVHAAARSLTADLSQAEQAAVFRDTAVRAYGLKPSR
jgi:L-fuconolactonase